VFCSSIDEHQRYRPQSWCNETTFGTNLFAVFSAKVFKLINGINVLNLIKQISVFVVVIECKFGLSSGIILKAVLQHQFVDNNYDGEGQL
jgi:hypothetical protein